MLDGHLGHLSAFLIIPAVLMGCTVQSQADRAKASPTTTTAKTIPTPASTDGVRPRVRFQTSAGGFTAELFLDAAPKTVENFLKLAGSGFYDGTKFHRVIRDFMIQGGDPLSKGAEVSRWGTGGPGYAFADEINGNKLVRGSLAMANSGPDTNGSQWFIVTAEAAPWLDGKHTNFGKIIDGYAVVEKISLAPTGENDRPVTDVTVLKISVQR